MADCTQVLGQILAFGQVVLLLLAVVEDNFEEDIVREGQVCRHTLEEEDHHVLPVLVEEVVRRSYSMSILDLLGCCHVRILILSLDPLHCEVFQKDLFEKRG
jgi:hypothetical protein